MCIYKYKYVYTIIYAIYYDMCTPPPSLHTHIHTHTHDKEEGGSKLFLESRTKNGHTNTMAQGKLNVKKSKKKKNSMAKKKREAKKTRIAGTFVYIRFTHPII